MGKKLTATQIKKELANLSKEELKWCEGQVD